MKKTILTRLAIPAAAFLALAGSGALAQNTRPVISGGPAQLSRDPSGRNTIGQSTLPIGGGVGAGGAGAAFGIQRRAYGYSPFGSPIGRRPLLWQRATIGIRR